jgi:hypothetical protein
MTPVKKSSVKVEAKKVVEAAKAETKKAAPKKAVAKKPAAKKAPTKKTAAPKAAVKKTVVVEFYGKQVNTADIVAKAEKAYQEAHKDTEIKTFEVYIKPEENAAYYVVNGEGSEDFKIALD